MDIKSGWSEPTFLMIYRSDCSIRSEFKFTWICISSGTRSFLLLISRGELPTTAKERAATFDLIPSSCPLHRVLPSFAILQNSFLPVLPLDLISFVWAIQIRILNTYRNNPIGRWQREKKIVFCEAARFRNCPLKASKHRRDWGDVNCPHSEF